MQKKIIALAVAGLVSGAAFADTNVVVYGVADLSFDVVSTTGGSPSSLNTGSYSRVTSNGSYLGFKGSEDLGNGLKAVFQFENAVTADGGGMFGTARDTFAGLTGAYGSMTLGTQTTPTRKLGTQIDVNAGATGIGNNKALIDRGWDTRQTNSALYVSPNLGNFSIGAAYISGEDKTTNAANALGTQQNSSGWDLGVTYDANNLLVGLTYADGKNRDAANTREKNTRLAGAYNFGQGSVRAIWDSNKVDTNAGYTKQNIWGLGGTFNVAQNGKLLAQYYRAKNVNTSAGDLANTGSKLWEIGYEHSLSKRTMIKAIYAQINNDSAAAANFETGAVRNVVGGVDPRGLQVGIRHSF